MRIEQCQLATRIANWHNSKIKSFPNVNTVVFIMQLKIQWTWKGDGKRKWFWMFSRIYPPTQTQRRRLYCFSQQRMIQQISHLRISRQITDINLKMLLNELIEFQSRSSQLATKLSAMNSIASDSRQVRSVRFPLSITMRSNLDSWFFRNCYTTPTTSFATLFDEQTTRRGIDRLFCCYGWAASETADLFAMIMDFWDHGFVWMLDWVGSNVMLNIFDGQCKMYNAILKVTAVFN